MSDILTRLMVDHAEAARRFREAMASELDGAADDAFQDEAEMMLALLCFPPQTIEQARRRARYLMVTRFADGLDMEGLAFLQSFTAEEEQPLTER